MPLYRPAGRLVDNAALIARIWPVAMGRYHTRRGFAAASDGRFTDRRLDSIKQNLSMARLSEVAAWSEMLDIPLEELIPLALILDDSPA